MDINLSDYFAKEPPSVRPFDVNTDLELVEDYMTAMRRLDFVATERAAMLEFVTLGYDLIKMVDLLNKDAPDIIMFHLCIDTPGGRIRMSAYPIVGVDAAGDMWFADARSHAFITAKNEAALKRKARERAEAELGPDFMDKMIQSMREQRQQEQQVDDGDWWKNGGDPP